jgi:hypothetical protein
MGRVGGPSISFGSIQFHASSSSFLVRRFLHLHLPHHFGYLQGKWQSVGRRLLEEIMANAIADSSMATFFGKTSDRSQM